MRAAAGDDRAQGQDGERRTDEQALRTTEQRLKLVMANAGMGAWDFTIRKAGFAVANEMILSGRLYSADELLYRRLIDVVADDGQGELALERLFVRPLSWYEEEKVELRLGTRVTAIHPAAGEIELGDGSRLKYRDLVLTTGSRPRRLPVAIGGDLTGVHTVRDLADADAIAPSLKAGVRLLVIGGGYIGLEAAAVAAQKGLAVTVIEMADRILQRVAAAPTSDYFRALHQARGVTIREKTGLARLVGEGGKLTGAELADGSFLPADLAIVGAYGLLRKIAVLGALEGLALETMLLAAPAFVALVLWWGRGPASFPSPDLATNLWLVGVGPLTAVPLLLFAAGARRIPMTTLGLLQYIGPSIQFALGVWLFNEPFGGQRLAGFGLIWAALLLYSADGWRSARRLRLQVAG